MLMPSTAGRDGEAYGLPVVFSRFCNPCHAPAFPIANQGAGLTPEKNLRPPNPEPKPYQALPFAAPRPG